MIAPGDKIAVGVSGGKDSMLLLTALALYRDHMGIPFEVEAITLMTGIPVADYTPVAETCARLNVPCTATRRTRARCAPSCGAARSTISRCSMAATRLRWATTATTHWRRLC